MSHKLNELSVIIKTRKLIEYIFTVTDKSPKKYRYSITIRLQNYSLDVMEYLIKANEVVIDRKLSKWEYEKNRKKRHEYQQTALTNMKLLGYMAMLARTTGCILPKQQEQIALMVGECQRLLYGWAKSDKERWDEQKKSADVATS